MLVCLLSRIVDIAWFLLSDCKNLSHSGGLILAMIEDVGIAINRAAAEQFKPGEPSLSSFILLLP